MIVSLYAGGMTVRDIQHHLATTLGVDMSPDTISTITDAVLDEVMIWQNRQLDEFYPVIFLDALRVKIRDGHRVVNKACYMAVGIDIDGIKHILGLWIADNEGAAFWASVCADLANRGVQDVFIVCCDGLKGLPVRVHPGDPVTGHFELRHTTAHAQRRQRLLTSGSLSHGVDHRQHERNTPPTTDETGDAERLQGHQAAGSAGQMGENVRLTTPIPERRHVSTTVVTDQGKRDRAAVVDLVTEHPYDSVTRTGHHLSRHTVLTHTLGQHCWVFPQACRPPHLVQGCTEADPPP